MTQIMRSDDYTTVKKTILYLQEHFRKQPSLEEIAQELGTDLFQLQKTFKRWAGISPKRFLQYLTLQHSENLLDSQSSVLDAALDSGLSGPGRLHDLFVSLKAVSPGEYKALGKGVLLSYGFHHTHFGLCLLAASERGLSALYFIEEDEKEAALADLQKYWLAAQLKHEPEVTEPYLAKMFQPSLDEKVPLWVKGTNLQIKVWEALLKIPEGKLCSYGDVASAIQHPTATRAVASAIGANPISFLIPCHRVLRKSGAIGGYRWGLPRKRALMAWERSQIPEPA